MTPEHTALVARLESNSKWQYGAAAAVIRALAGEVEQLTEELETAEAVHDGVALERDTLRAEVAALKIDNQTLRDLLAIAEERNEL